jgi:hypothetical protein
LRVAAAATSAVLGAGSVPPAAAAIAGAKCGDGSALLVTGRVMHQLRLCPARLADYGNHTVSLSFKAANRTQMHKFSGSLLVDVLEAAGPRVKAGRKGDLSRFTVTAIGIDGYAATVAWGEIGPDFEGKQVLLAAIADGRALDRARLVVPGDTKGGRDVTDVVRLQVNRA